MLVLGHTGEGTTPATMLSKQQLKDVRKIFDTFDVDLSGTIDCSELRFMFRGKAP